MNNDLNDYINGIVNAVELHVTISREISSSGTHNVYIKVGEKELYNFWHNPKKKKGQPKHTGGKRSYVKLYIDWIEKTKLSVESSGTLMRFSNKIQWSTGVLMNLKTKKLLKLSDIIKIIGKSKPTALNILQELKDNNCIQHTKEGYKVNTSYIGKGVSNQNENNKI